MAAGREGEARTAGRNASLVGAQRVLDLVRAFVFAAFVPRLLGPEDFGRFALLLGVSEWFALLSGLGTVQVLGRFVPVLERQDPAAGAAGRLFGSLLALRIATGALASVLFFVVMRAWLPDLSALLVAPFAGMIVLRASSSVLFGFLLGRNEAQRWAAGEMARRWISLGLVAGLTLTHGLRGASLAILLAELPVLALGLHWTRAHLRAVALRPDLAFLAPYLHFGLAFFASNLLVVLAHRAGEPLVRATTAGYAEVGHFALIGAGYLGVSQGIGQILMSFLPLLSARRADGDLAGIAEWSRRVLALVSAGGAVGILVAVAAGRPLVVLVAGHDFLPSVPLVVPFAVAFLAHAAGGLGRLLALTFDRPRLTLAAASAQVGTLAVLGPALAVRHGPFGVALAIAAGAAADALVVLWGVRAAVRVRRDSRIASSVASR